MIVTSSPDDLSTEMFSGKLVLGPWAACVSDIDHPCTLEGEKCLNLDVGPYMAIHSINEDVFGASYASNTSKLIQWCALSIQVIHPYMISNFVTNVLLFGLRGIVLIPFSQTCRWWIILAEAVGGNTSFFWGDLVPLYGTLFSHCNLWCHPWGDMWTVEPKTNFPFI